LTYSTLPIPESPARATSNRSAGIFSSTVAWRTSRSPATIDVFPMKPPT
jgi:hypothetical protein